jgi:hypothetical protein
MDYIAELEDAVAKKYGTYRNEVTIHDGQITVIDSGMYRKKRLTPPSGGGRK